MLRFLAEVKTDSMFDASFGKAPLISSFSVKTGCKSIIISATFSDFANFRLLAIILAFRIYLLIVEGCPLCPRSHNNDKTNMSNLNEITGKILVKNIFNTCSLWDSRPILECTIALGASLKAVGSSSKTTSSNQCSMPLSILFLPPSRRSHSQWEELEEFR